jgi:DNA polymerase-1
MHIPIIEEWLWSWWPNRTIAKQVESKTTRSLWLHLIKISQLVSENIFMYKPARMGNGIEIWVKFEEAKFEIRPSYWFPVAYDAAIFPGLPR